MTKGRTTTMLRWCAPALAPVLAASAVTGAGAREQAPARPVSAFGGARPVLAPPARFAPALARPARVREARAPLAPPRPLVSRPIALVADTPWGRRPARPVAPRVRFPVAGRVSYGEGGARFGASRGGRAHAGQDVFARPGTPVVAVRDGTVVESSRDGGGGSGGRGYYVAIFSREARETYVYLHLIAPPRVGRGDKVRAGERLGGVGCSGSCSGDHLHFEVRAGRKLEGRARDPLPLLRRWRRSSR